MRRKHGSATLDRGGEPLGDAAGTHVVAKSINRRLPLGCLHLLGDTVVGNDAGVTLRQRHEDQDSAAVPGIGDAADDELLECRTMRPRPAHAARNQRQPERRQEENKRGDDKDQS